MPKKPADSTRTANPPRPRASRKRDDRLASEPPMMTAPDAANDNGSLSSAPSYDQIAEAAYHRFLQRGAQHGQDFSDWIEAERELRERPR